MRTKVLIAVAGVGVLLAVALVPRHYPKRVWRETKRQWLIATGGMYDVDGVYLRITCKGEGVPTVLFENGLAQTRESWGTVTEEISKTRRVCTYDRANVGESDPVEDKRTSANVVDELKTLLDKAGEKGPYVFVGHSFGGLNARLYESRYPADVAGLVLIDPSHEGQYDLIASYLSPSEAEEYRRRESGENLEDIDLPSSSEIVRSFAAHSKKPVVILIPSPGAADKPWSEAVRALSTSVMQYYPCGRLVRVAGNDHFIQLESPDKVIESIDWVINDRTGDCQ